MIKQIRNILFLVLLNCSVLGCGTYESGTNEQDNIGKISFYVQNQSNLLIKNTDIIYISPPTFTCHDNINRASVLCPKTKQILGKIKPDIEKKITDLGYHVTEISNQANLFLSLNIDLYIRNYRDYRPNSSAFDNNDPYERLIAIQNGSCGNNPVTLKQAYQILNNPQRENCNSYPVDAYEYNYNYTLNIFEKNNPSTSIYQSKIKPILINGLNLYELINKMLDANFATFPMKGNVIVMLAGRYPKLEPVKIRFNLGREEIE